MNKNRLYTEENHYHYDIAFSIIQSEMRNSIVIGGLLLSCSHFIVSAYEMCTLLSIIFATQLIFPTMCRFESDRQTDAPNKMPFILFSFSLSGRNRPETPNEITKIFIFSSISRKMYFFNRVKKPFHEFSAQSSQQLLSLLLLFQTHWNVNRMCHSWLKCHRKLFDIPHNSNGKNTLTHLHSSRSNCTRTKSNWTCGVWRWQTFSPWKLIHVVQQSTSKKKVWNLN